MFEPTKTEQDKLYEGMMLDMHRKFKNIRESMEGTDEAPQTMRTQDDPNIEAEDFNMEDYRDDDLEKVKSKTEEVPKEVPDSELEQKPLEPKGKKHKTKESRKVKENDSHPLNLCNECARTFRNDKRICLYCDSVDVLPILSVNEGILELVGEIEGISMREQNMIRRAVEKGAIKNEWPDEDTMIDALSQLEDFVDPGNEPGDVRTAYLRHVVVPRALSLMEESVELKFKGKSQGTFDTMNEAMVYLRGNVDYSWHEAFKNRGWTLEQGGENIDMTEARVQESDGMEDRLENIKTQIRAMSDQELSTSMAKMIQHQAGTRGEFTREHNQAVIDFMDEEWNHRARAAFGSSVDEQEEEAAEDHGVEARKAEMRAKMAEAGKKHSQEMERMAKELEGMDR